MSLSHITSHCFVNAPFLYLQKNINSFLERGIQPEIGLEGEVLYSQDRKDFETIAIKLQNNNLSCTLHAPFFELSIGSLDPFIRKVSRDKYKKAFELIEIFQPKSIVCHLGFEENKHGYKEKEWFKYTLEGWQELVEISANHHTPVMLENTYEKNPRQHKKIFEALSSPFAGFCLDVGHVMAFAGNSWQDWLPELKPWLGQLHLHDNDGQKDRHLPIGSGLFDFKGLAAYLTENSMNPLVTLEPHREEDVEPCLLAFEKFFLQK